MKSKLKKTGTLTGQEMKVYISDAASHREVDENGRLIVRDTLITRESVDPYYGREIPGYEDFGLEPDRVYHIYRPAAELKKAIKKFDGVPVLDTHIMDNPGSEQKEHRIGAVSDAKMDGGAVFADLSIWDQDAIDKIKSGEKRELSAGYSADTYLKPAEFNGEHYDLIMKNLNINHIALVRKGRVPGAMVYDEDPNLKEPIIMEIEEVLKLVSSELAAAGVDKDAAEKVILKIKEYKPEPKPEEVPENRDEQPAAGPVAESPKQEPAAGPEAEKVSEKVEETKEEVKTELAPEEAKKDAEPAPAPVQEEKKEEVKEAAEEKKEEVEETKIQDTPEFQEMLKEAVKSALKEISEAREAVEDVCGKMSAMDSAEELYKAGCSYFGIKTEGRDPGEFKTLFEGAKAGFSKVTSKKTAVLDAKPEQPAEEPEFLKKLPKRQY